MAIVGRCMGNFDGGPWSVMAGLGICDEGAGWVFGGLYVRGVGVRGLGSGESVVG